MNGPGDRASKIPELDREPTPFLQAEGHGAGPTRVDVGPALPPGSESSARLHWPAGRESGDLEGASPAMVAGRQRREGPKPQSVQHAFQESDAVIVPEKSAKTWVTPVELMEGRTKAKGNPLHETRSRHRTGEARSRSCSGSGDERRTSPSIHG